MHGTCSCKSSQEKTMRKTSVSFAELYKNHRWSPRRSCHRLGVPGDTIRKRNLDSEPEDLRTERRGNTSLGGSHPRLEKNKSIKFMQTLFWLWKLLEECLLGIIARWEG